MKSILLMVIIQMVVEAAHIPELYEPMELTWMVHVKEQKLLSVTGTTPGTWFLEITLSGKDLFCCAIWTQSPQGHFYICPAHDADEKSCGSSDYFYCTAWDCEAPGHIYWKAKDGDWITMYLREQDSGIFISHKHYVSMDNLYSFNGSNAVYPTLGISFTDKG